MNALRRYEILLPLRFNDGRPVPEELTLQTVLDLRERFGAVSAETQPIQGQWVSEGRLYRDDNVRLFVDVPDTEDNRAYFGNLKGTLKVRFQQVDIWITSHAIEVI